MKRGEAEKIILSALKKGIKREPEVRALFKSRSTYFYARNKLIEDGLIIYSSKNVSSGRQYGELIPVRENRVANITELKLYLKKIYSKNDTVKKQAETDIKHLCDSHLLDVKSLKILRTNYFIS